MDELRRKDVVARRLALAFAICCTTTGGSAADVASGEDSIRRLLTRGWESSSMNGPSELTRAAVDSSLPWPTESRPETKDGATTKQLEPAKSKTPVPVTPELEREERVSSLSELIRRGADQRPIREQRVSAPLRSDESRRLSLPVLPPPDEPEIEFDAAPIENATVESELQDKVARSESLADLMRSYRDEVAVPTPPITASLAKQKAPETLVAPKTWVAPRHRPLPQAKESLSSREAGNRLLVQSAPEMPEKVAESTISRQPGSKSPSDTSGAMVARAVPVKQSSSRVPTLAHVPPRIVPVLNQPPGPSQAASDLNKTDSVSASKTRMPAAPAVSDITTLAVAPPSLALPESIAEEAAIEPSAVTPRSPDGDPTISKLLTAEEGLGSNLAKDAFTIPPIPSLEYGPSLAPPIPLPPPTPSVTLHTTRLLELAQHSILKSQKSLLRGATRTARKDAIDALQAIVAMRDAQEGGNVHSQQLEQAFDAIRESKDFCGEFGTIDTIALRRMVDVHETTVLKQSELTTISALEATEAYLDFAKEQLVLAIGGVREGSQALVLLGQTEFQIARREDTHSTSVAVAVQRAAVDADPYFAAGYRVLGSTLMDLGLVEEAANCLITSVRIQPTRMGYERLLDAARRLGDIDTARICMSALEDPRMDEGNMVHTLTPQDFAATYRPAPRLIESSRSPSNSTPVKAQAEPAARMSFGSLFPFGRR